MLSRLLVLLAAPAIAFATTLPATPDAGRYPTLVAMKAWLESGGPEPRHCALSAGLFAEASEVYRRNRSEPQTLDALMKRHAGSLPTADRERLRSTLMHVTSLAAALATLDADNAPIAYSQLCIGRAQQPKATLSNDRIKVQFDAAVRCGATGTPGSLERKECVAAAFKVQ